MHILFRESGGLEEAATPQDLGQTPADLVVLSLSDSDLAAFAEGWRRDGGLPSLRLAQIARLMHPVSVDQYVDATLSGARAVLVRLIGGANYWQHGVMQLQDLARRRGIRLALLPGDGTEDRRLRELSTVEGALWDRLNRLCAQGGHEAAGAALRLLAGMPATDPAPLAPVGWLDGPPPGEWVAIPFYRSWMLAGDIAPIRALIAAFAERGFDARGIFLPSLKSPEAQSFLRDAFAANPPLAVVNTTGFSTGDGNCPLRSGPPVFQAVVSTAPERLWRQDGRGLSPADLAMHVVLPEVDGRIPAQIVSVKDQGAADPALEFAPLRHKPLPDRIAALADRVTAWLRLRERPPLALVLSTYPGKPWLDAHAVGLDATASAQAMLRHLGHEPPDLARGLRQGGLDWPLADYLRALESLPRPLHEALHDAWGPPENDPQIDAGRIRFHALRCGPHIVALQPERGRAEDRESGYHDLTVPPRHAYVAFYLWLRASRIGAIVHIGAHGTLEWLPGKAAAQSAACWPEALAGPLPVIYPFIVNDPGEAAQARRRLGAVTPGHMPPPLAPAQLPEKFVNLEQMLDRYSTADGIDPARRDRLAAMIADEARALGLMGSLGLSGDAFETLSALDRFVCELKESRYSDGLHVWGEAPGEWAGLDAALAGRHVAPGPSGSPWRGAGDVLPTGRNLFAVDPRALPAPESEAKGRMMADELIRGYLQDHGDYPREVMVDLWGSATMRTGGEDLAMALALAGLRALRDPGTGRVNGIEVVPLAELGRPRVGVSLKISGLFRDSFPVLIRLFTLGCNMLARREESAADNPYLSAEPRVFGPPEGVYGTGIDIESAPEAVAGAWLANGGFAHDGSDPARPAGQALRDRLGGLSAHVHTQDLPETDLLMSEDYAAHIGGIAAALREMGRDAPLYHFDNTRAERVTMRELGAELARITWSRAAARDWILAMMRHGPRGAAEIAAGTRHLVAFARLTGRVPPPLLDSIAQATLLDDEVLDFLREQNPQALDALLQALNMARDEGLWPSRHNALLTRIGELNAAL